MYPLAFAAGVAIEYKARVKRWLQYIHDRPVDNSIHEAGCRDQALFRLKNIKLLVSAGLIAVVQQMIVGVVQVLFQALHVAQGGGRGAFSAQAAQGSLVQIVKRYDLVVHEGLKVGGPAHRCRLFSFSAIAEASTSL